MKENKVVPVKIGNMTYHLSAAENSQYIQEIAQEADEMMREIKRNNPALNTINVAVLALINALDQKVKLQTDQDHPDAVGNLLSESELKAKLMELREECWELKKELLYYRNLAEVYEEKINELTKLSVQDTGKSKPAGRNEIRPLDKLQTSFQDLEEQAKQ